MICPYCESDPFRESRFFNIQNVKERFNPTYYHTQIFNPSQPEAGRVRCTPTFHSRALQVDGYRHCCKLNHQNTQIKDKPKTTYCVHQKQSKANSSCGCRGRSCYKSREKWYDEDKNQIFKHQHNDCCYSKQRKFLDLASSSVFNGFQYGKDHQCQHGPEPSQLVNDYQCHHSQQERKSQSEVVNQIVQTNEVDQSDSNKQTKKQVDKQITKQANKQAIKEAVINEEVTFGKKKGDTMKRTNNTTKTVKFVNERPKFTVIRSKK